MNMEQYALIARLMPFEKNTIYLPRHKIEIEWH